MEKYTFQEYNATGGRIIPSISLGESGGFGVSAGFIKKYDISPNTNAVKLFYDKTNKAVAFRFSEKLEDGMLKIKMAPNRGGGHISANSFLIKFDLDPKKYKGRYTPEEIEMPNVGKVYVIELQEKENF